MSIDPMQVFFKILAEVGESDFISFHEDSVLSIGQLQDDPETGEPYVNFDLTRDANSAIHPARVCTTNLPADAAVKVVNTLIDRFGLLTDDAVTFYAP
jgi:hypothetical protein